MISIVVPAYNEEDVIEKFISEVMKVKMPEEFELVIVNDGSKDRTREIVEKLMKKYKNLRLVNHPTNLNFGRAIRTGIQSARGRFIVTMDSDLTHPPSLVPKLVEGLKNADVCVASRYISGGGMRDVPWWRVWISVVANRIFGYLYGTNLRDITAGFKAYRAEKVKGIKLTRKSFEVQVELMAKLIKAHARFKEIPLVLHNRKEGLSKFNYFKVAPRYFVHVIELMIYRWVG